MRTATEFLKALDLSGAGAILDYKMLADNTELTEKIRAELTKDGFELVGPLMAVLATDEFIDPILRKWTAVPKDRVGGLVDRKRLIYRRRSSKPAAQELQSKPASEGDQLMKFFFPGLNV